MIQVRDISFNYIGEDLYKSASFSLPKNKKAGLVGLNGAGKSTLFQLLLRNEWPDEGKIRIEGSVELVPQEVKRDPVQDKAASVREYLNLARPHKDRYLSQMLDKMEMNNVSLDDRPRDLSGGQKTKLALLFAVFKEPDILLLDEPTNFLDTAGKKWVMHFLSQYKKSLLVVSHDLDLLDKHIDKVVYINKQTKKFEEYTGTYSKFKKLKSDRDQHLTKYIQNQQQKLKRMQKSVDKLRRSNVEKVIRQRVQLEKRMQKITDTLPELPQEIVRIKLQLPTPAHIGELPVMVRGLSKSYGDTQVLTNVNFSIRKRERVALIGHNGSGKSTLIKAILGIINTDSGQTELDERAKVGYYSQEFESFDFNLSLFETLKQHTHADEGQIRSFLAKFMFAKDQIFQQVGTLSGGEKTRLSIAMLMLKDYNFLVLDEPTTYLDVLSQKIILEALKIYQGTMLVVSHTPDFLKGLKPDKALLMPEQKLVYWDSAYLDRASQM